MLISYNDDYEKITMGLLSYITDFKDPKRLAEELALYEDDSSREIYLWQSEETKNLIAVLGIEEEGEIVLLRHIAIDPSFRKEGLIYVLLDHLVEKVHGKKIVGTLETASIISKWQKKKNQN
ncbi:MAG: N-acetyltransferase [Atopostipes suicloacalis]|nr:N-acetyltransferase [Atopostipes suicloacalis]MDN6731501.1 N-acetyltransferase [Atopostipes suicloacalis]